MCKTVHTANQISPQYVVWQRKQRIDYMRVNTCCLKNHRSESPKQAAVYNSTDKLLFASLFKFESHYHLLLGIIIP